MLLLINIIIYKKGVNRRFFKKNIRDYFFNPASFRKTASYGHFGRDDPDFTWEKTDKVELLKKEAGLKK